MHDADIMELDEKIHSLIDQQKYPEALKLATECVNEEPDSDEAYFLKSYAHLMWGQLDQAEMDLKKAISLDPGNPKYYNCMGLIHLDMNRYEDAHAEFSRALHIEPDNLLYRSNLCKANIYLGNADNMLEEVEGMYRNNSDSELLRDNLAEIYSIASFKDWHYVQEEDSHYALSHKHIENAEKYTAKAKALETNDEKVLGRLAIVDDAVKISKKRRYTGGWPTLLLALIFAVPMLQGHSPVAYLYGVCALLYYYALRTPQYVINHLSFSGKDGLSFADRISSVFVSDGWVFFGSSYGDALMSQAKTNLFLSVLRGAIRLLLLPLSVLMGLFNNYSKNHAYSILGGMIAVIAILTFA